MSEEIIDGEIVEEANLPVVAPPSHSTALVARDDITVEELVQQSNIIKRAMQEAMQEGIHYGAIPGVQKPTLLKAGAEKLLVLFRLSPSYESDKIWHDDGHLTVMTRCTLHHIPTGLKIAEGEGLCTTKESRYAFRQGGRVCPECGQSAIIKGKPEYGGGWICFKKKNGCGAKWDDGTDQAKEFEGANLDRVDNPDIADSYNTVLKMADKRALLAAILNGTAASDIFTQDMEERAPAVGVQSTIVDSPPPQREFDPSVDLLPSAPEKKRGWKGIHEVLAGIDPSLDWGPIIRQSISSVYGGDGDFRKLDEPHKTQAAYRTANAAGRLLELADKEGGPEGTVSDGAIQKAFAEMFGGVVVDIPVEQAPLS